MISVNVVSREDWINARIKLLKKEKEFSKARDELTHERQNMPWVRVDKDYRFDSPTGKENLKDLFSDKSQLIIYHFMFDSNWNEGCKSCSFVADHYNPSIVHLANRDVNLVTVSKAPLDKIEKFKQRMGWKFKWVSSSGSDFNSDFNVSFTDEEIKNNQVNYNFQDNTTFPVNEAPGISVFVIDKENDKIYHTYSTYARGLENFIGTYNLLDIVPKGRDENNLSYGMEWVRHSDSYDDENFIDPYIHKYK